jgi:spermidine/putrescine transport system permease protein
LSNKRQEIGTTLPSFGWLALFVLAPTLLVFAIAFRTTDLSGGIGDGWTLGQFRVFGEKSVHILLWRTLWISALTTALCLMLALPVAWFISRSSAVTPISPPSGPTQWLFQGPPAESNFLGASQSPERRG